MACAASTAVPTTTSSNPSPSASSTPDSAPSVAATARAKTACSPSATHRRSASHLVERAGRPIDLTAREFALLELFRHPNRIVTRELAEAHVWSYDFAGTSNVVDVYVRRLRRKIDDPSDLRALRNCARCRLPPASEPAHPDPGHERSPDAGTPCAPALRSRAFASADALVRRDPRGGALHLQRHGLRRAGAQHRVRRARPTSLGHAATRRHLQSTRRPAAPSSSPR
ncbi:MAG: winged helix-turn-helix domain-containing protein [Thermomicrobiales bacterium]